MIIRRISGLEEPRNILDLPREMFIEIFPNASTSSVFLFLQTCHHTRNLATILDRNEYKKYRENRFNIVKICALDEGSISVLEYLSGLGMTITPRDYHTHTNIQNLDTILWARDKIKMKNVIINVSLALFASYQLSMEAYLPFLRFQFQ